MQKLMYLFSFLCLLVGISFSSCSGSDEELPSVSNDDEYVVVPIKLEKEYVEITDVPMRAVDNRKAVYAINVYEKHPNISNTLNSYAYGVFDNIENISIKLNKNREYRFRVALFYDFFDKYELKTLNPVGKISAPTNQFTLNEYPTKTEIAFLSNFSSNTDKWSYSKNTESDTNIVECESYCGTLEDFSPASGNVCSVFLYRISVHMEFQAEGLTTGEISISVLGLKFSLTPTNNIRTVQLCHNDCFVEYEPYQKDKFKDIASFNVFVDYIADTGDKTYLLAEMLSFERNYRKRILIKLNSESSTEINSSLTFNKEEVEITDQEQITYDCII